MLPKKRPIDRFTKNEFTHYAGMTGLITFLLLETKIAIMNPEFFHAADLYMGITAIISICTVAKGVKNHLEQKQ